jgi:hypothetical protein
MTLVTTSLFVVSTQMLHLHFISFHPVNEGLVRAGPGATVAAIYFQIQCAKSAAVPCHLCLSLANTLQSSTPILAQ